MNITQEQHDLLILMGFTERRETAGCTTYWHEGTGIFLKCVSELTMDLYDVKPTGLDIVIGLPNDTSPAHMLCAAEFPVDAVKLKDLPQFMMYRTFSAECAEHRLVRASFEKARETYHAADRDADAAKQFFDLAAATMRQEMDAVLALPKPPAFRPVDTA